MNVIHRISELAESAAQRYDIVLQTYRNIYEGSMNEHDFGYQKQFSRIKKQSYKIAKNYLEVESDIISSSLIEISSEAHTKTIFELRSNESQKEEDRTGDIVEAAGEYLITELSIQLERDIAFLIKSVRNSSLSIKMSAQSQGISAKSALVQHKIGEVKFVFRDRVNSKWPSRKFVRSAWRQSLLQAYNNTVLTIIAAHGLNNAEVTHTEGSSKWNGTILAISPETSYPTYNEVEGEIFHPNSNAILSVPGGQDVYSK